VHGVSPNGTMIAMRVANSLLPGAVGNRDRRYGGEIHREVESYLWRFAVTPGMKAAEELQEELVDQLTDEQSRLSRPVSPRKAPSHSERRE
jgi:hypothetical protein